MNNTYRVSLNNYLLNMEELFDEMNKFTSKVLCVGLAPIDQSKTVPFVLEKSISFYADDQREYGLALEKLCSKKHVVYVSLKSSGLENHLSYDGVHPISSGHALIAEVVLDANARLG
jgi:hypothetical protein